MRILVCGGRDYTNRAKVFDVLNAHGPAVVVTGDASGADTLAAEWARATCTPLFQFFANWSQFGKSAGPIRNGEMLKNGKPDLVIAFSGGRGTANMVQQARTGEITVIEIQDGPQAER